jgi:cyclin-dependent kinase-like
MDPKERLSCREALKHPYFEDLGEAQDFLKNLDMNGGDQVQAERQEGPKHPPPTFQMSSTVTVPSTAQNVIRNKVSAIKL